MFAHILMPTDGTDHSERAIKRGIVLAKLCGAKVTGIHVMPDDRPEALHIGAVVRRMKLSADWVSIRSRPGVA